MFDVEDARYEEAIPLLKKALAEQPDLPVANMQYGIAQARLKNYAEAIPSSPEGDRSSIPDNGLGRYELGLALFETGKWKDAAPQFEAAVEQAPEVGGCAIFARPRFTRASIAFQKPMEHLDICLGLDPNHYRANLLRGRILSLQKRPRKDCRILKKQPKCSPIPARRICFLPTLMPS